MERLTVNDLNKVGYDPWELCGMDKHCTKGCHEEGGCTKGCHILKMYRKLAEYEDLEEQGKLPKLSCTVGDIVYALWSVPTEQKYVIYSAEVKEICLGVYMNRRTIQYRLEPISYSGRILKFYQDDFGKKLFLEESEAEAALKEMTVNNLLENISETPYNGDNIGGHD